VQRGARHLRPCKLYRDQFRDGREHTRSSHLQRDGPSSVSARSGANL
jgi:hypothetical protein